MKEFVASRPYYQKILKSLSERRKIIQVRNLDLHKERKSTGEEKSEGEIKVYIFYT